MIRSQFIGRIGAVVPQVRERVRAARRPGIFVGDIDESRLGRIAQYGVEPRAFRGPIGKLAVAVIDGDFIPESDIHGVRLQTDQARHSDRATPKGAGSPSPRPTRRVRAEMRSAAKLCANPKV